MSKSYEKGRHLLFLVTEDWYFWIHWLGLARAARDAGWRVTIATRVNEHGTQIEAEGFQLKTLRLSRRSFNPVREALALLELVRLYLRECPDVVHHVALKPVLYGSLAARIARIHGVVNAFPGLGSIFLATGIRAGGLRWLLKRALRVAVAIPRAAMIFQNEDDRAEFVAAGIAGTGQTMVISGVGVDTGRFTPAPEVPGTPIALLASRMLRDKGLAEFAEAARILKRRRIPVRCVLAGRVDAENPTHIAEDTLRSWSEEGILDWLGQRENMPELLRSVHIVVLPSYREGLPTILVEAGACGRPVVATDVPGCRDVVRNGANGFLVAARDAVALADAISTLATDAIMRANFGARGREIAVAEFSAQEISRKTLGVYEKL